MSDRLVPLGQLVATHGIEGWLKLKPYNPQSTILFSTRKVILDKGGIVSSHCVEKSKPHKRHILVKLGGTDGISDAKGLVGSVLSVEEEALHPLGSGEYYHYQAVGLDVFDTRGNRVGKITKVWLKEGGDLYVVTGPTKDYLIPATKEVIETVDLRAGKIIINPPEGLLDL